MITFGLGGLALLTEGLGINLWTGIVQKVIVYPRLVDVESIVFTDVSEELEINE